MQAKTFSYLVFSFLLIAVAKPTLAQKTDRGQQAVIFLNPRLVVIGTDTLPINRLSEQQKALVEAEKKVVAEESYRMALAHVANQQTETAANALNKALVLDPSLARAFLLRASLTADKGQQEAALRDFDRALALEDSLPQAWFGKGLLLMQQGQAEKAEKSFDKAALLRPSADHFFWRGAARKEVGMYKNAITDFDSTLSWQPEREEALFHKAECFLLNGDTAQALTQWEMLLKKNNDTKTALKISRIYLQNKQPEAVFRTLNPILEQDTSACQAHLLVGRTYWLQEQWEQAALQFTKAIECEPSFAEAYHHRAAAYAKLKDFESAATDADKALSLREQYPEAYFNRGNIREMLRNPEGACDDWQKALEMGIAEAEEFVEENCGKE